MKVLKNIVIKTDISGDKHNCYVVSAIRTKNWQGRCSSYTYHHYFDVDTLQDVIL